MAIKSYGLGKNFSSSGGGSGLWITDARIQGNTGTFLVTEYGEGPNGQELALVRIITDATHLDIDIVADRSLEYKPAVKVQTVDAINAIGVDNAESARLYGTFQYLAEAVPVGAKLTASTIEGSSYTVAVLKEAPAVMTDLMIVNAPATSSFYPAVQTEVKQGDTFYISFTVDKGIDRVVISGVGAGTAVSMPITMPEGGDVVDFPVICGSTTASMSGTQKMITVNTRTIAGATSVDDYQSSNTILCNNLYPTITIGDAAYPNGQQALKGSEEATLTTEAINYTTLVFDSPNAQVSIPDTTVLTADKTVTRIDGDYNVSVPNFEIEANRAENGATTIESSIVRIADAAHTFNVTVPPQLSSGGNDGTTAPTHTVTLTSDQWLLEAPTMVSPAGTLGMSFSYTLEIPIFTIGLTVQDTVLKGDYSFNTFLTTNLAGITVTAPTTPATYTLEGFVTRSMALPPFNRTLVINTNIDAGDYDKVGSTWSFIDNATLTYSTEVTNTILSFTILSSEALLFNWGLLDFNKADASTKESTVVVSYNYGT